MKTSRIGEKDTSTYIWRGKKHEKRRKDEADKPETHPKTVGSTGHFRKRIGEHFKIGSYQVSNKWIYIEISTIT